MEPVKELNPGSWVICPASGGCIGCGHMAILPFVELKGYPIYKYSV
jgi:hypothetical protein